MKQVNATQLMPEAYQAMLQFSKTVKPEAITPQQSELIKVYVSQLNGCAFCLNMHTEKAIVLGETVQRLHLLPAWRNTALFSKEEKALLEVAEHLTLLAVMPKSKNSLDEVTSQLTAQQLAEVKMITAVINAWNRIMEGVDVRLG